MRSARLEAHGATLFINVYNYERAARGDIHDDNWLLSMAEVRSPALSIKCNLSILAMEVEDFRAQLLAIESGTSQNAIFETMEEQLKIEFRTTTAGKIDAAISIRQDCVPEFVSQVNLEVDPASLTRFSDDLFNILAEFPVRR